MNCLIYPFRSVHESLVNTINSTRKDINVVTKVAQNGYAPALKEKGYEFTTDFNEALKNVEGVIICDCRDSKWMTKDLIVKIKLALNSGKIVYNCNELKKEAIEEIESMPGFDNKKFINLAVYPDKDKLSSEYFVDVDCPVIAIGNMLRGLDNSTGLFELTRRFGERGFKTVSVGITFDCKLIGGYVFPTNIFDFAISEEDKIELINSYINDVQIRTGADVIVLDIPDGFMKYSDEVREGFGIRALMTTSAVSIDFFILNIPSDQIDGVMMPKLNTHFEQKYNISIDVVAIDSKYIQHDDTIESQTVCYYPANDRHVDEAVAVFDEVQSIVLTIRLNDRNRYADVVSRCVSKLSGIIEEL